MKAHVIYVSRNSNSQENLQMGINESTWGFKGVPDKINSGDVVLLGTQYYNASSNNSPRVPLDQYVQGFMGKVFLTRATGSVKKSNALLWQDELSANKVLYPYRFPLLCIGMIDNQTNPSSLPAWQEHLAEAFRLSATNRGALTPAELSPDELDELAVLAGLKHWDASYEQVDVGSLALSSAAPREQSAPRSQDPRWRSAVEQHAVQMAADHYRREGFVVEELGKPYDLRCTRGSEEKHVEVKGTSTAGGTVILTRNEVEEARRSKLPSSNFASDLFIVTDIFVDRSNDYTTSGGRASINSNWEPDASHMVALQFQYAVPMDEMSPLD